LIKDSAIEQATFEQWLWGKGTNVKIPKESFRRKWESPVLGTWPVCSKNNRWPCDPNRVKAGGVDLKFSHEAERGSSQSEGRGHHCVGSHKPS
jgi:hypothetical protein